MANPSSDDLSSTPPPTGRFAQFGYAYKLTKRLDPQLPYVMLGYGGGVAVVVFVAGQRRLVDAMKTTGLK